MRYAYACSLANKLNATVVFDMACGNGYGTRMLASSIKHVTGFDHSQIFINEAKGFKTHNADYYPIDLNKARIIDRHLGKPDLITSFETLEHLLYPENALRLFADTLERGGYLVCSIPKAYFEPQVDGKPMNQFHKQLFTLEEASMLIESNGFRIQSILGQPLPNLIINYARFLSKPLDKVAFTNQSTFMAISHLLASPTKLILQKTYSHIFVAHT